MLDAVVFVSGSVTSFGLVWLIRRQALRLGLMDAPNQRSMHREPKPRGGGAAIVIVCLIGLPIAAAAGLRPGGSVLAGFAAGALLVATVSWLEDVRSVPVGIRLAVQVVAGTLMVAGLVAQSGPQLFGPAVVVWLAAAGAVIWIVGLANIYNFVDGIDGLAASQGVIAGLGWAVVAMIGNQPWIGLLAVLLASGSAGFLFHNWPPARIFMGDVGSVFLGFSFASIALIASHGELRYALAGVLMLWPVTFDATYTLLRRVARGENVLIAHRSHLYQRLVLAGWRHASVTMLYAVLGASSVGLAILWWVSSSIEVQGAIGAGVVAVALVPLALVTSAERPGKRTGDVRSLMER